MLRAACALLAVFLFTVLDDLIALLFFDHLWPGWRSHWIAITTAFLPIALLGLVVALFGVRAQRLQPVTGPGVLPGRTGAVLAAITPDCPGQVWVSGEIWRARSDEPIGVGERVVVLAVEGLTLYVRRGPGSRPAR
jgi:membrane-bound serine protease (ClpP class)